MVDALEFHARTNHSTEELLESQSEEDEDGNEDEGPDPEIVPRQYKEYVDRPSVRLPRVRPPQGQALSVIAERSADPTTGTDASPRSSVDLETLATLCYEATGILREVTRSDGQEVAYRAASCTGKAYHVELYLVSADVDGLDAGVYHFDPRSFSFERLRSGDYRGVLARAAGDPDGSASTGIADAPVTAVATSNWWRNAWGYLDRAYRHGFWDSGTVVGNLLATAHALDYPAQVVAGFDDRAVAGLLGIDPGPESIDPESEAPLELVPIGIGDRAPDPPDVDPVNFETVPPSTASRDRSLLYEAWAASTIDGGSDATNWRSRCREAGPIGRAAAGDGERVPLDPVDPETAAARSLRSTIDRRRSCREYHAEGPTRRQVGTVLDRATRGVPGDWNGGTASGLWYNDVYVLATGVDGIPDGKYQFHPSEAALERLGETSVEEKTHLALAQEWAGEAHCNVYLLADLDAVVDRLGDRGYRLAQLEAGLTLGRLYLATYAHRYLGGTGLTFSDEDVTDHLSPRAAGQSPTVMFAFGRRGD